MFAGGGKAETGELVIGVERKDLLVIIHRGVVIVRLLAGHAARHCQLDPDLAIFRK